MRIVIGNSSLARYQQGGGHWMVRLQWLLGLRALGHDVFLLELLPSEGNWKTDRSRIARFFRTLKRYDLHERASLLLFEVHSEHQVFSSARVFGLSRMQTRRRIQDADVLWNDCCGIRQPLLGMFRKRLLLDLDPGLLQVSGLTTDFGLEDHDVFFTVGSKVGDPDCDVPTLGKQWHLFKPVVHLPFWRLRPDPGPDAPFSTITHWEWHELRYAGKTLSCSKRDAYLRYLDLPVRSDAPFELALSIPPKRDPTGDRALLSRHGWRLRNPWKVASSPERYREYIAASRGEILCAKPIYRELRTGWLSDRSAAYLASGRPVLYEDTDLGDVIPVGRGIVLFRDLEGAVAGAADIRANYPSHQAAARDLATEHFDARKVLAGIVETCGAA